MIIKNWGGFGFGGGGGGFGQNQELGSIPITELSILLTRRTQGPVDESGGRLLNPAPYCHTYLPICFQDQTPPMV
ncbi:hypothetical protein RchiOBHm_Chr5g0064461 [Rosa chinensis]|uniref:Uncharacterized protein n=1 Tax=Rosa chinensis TaxID=74649 RepID=A0A2P6QIQ1_ROSCH|nr:hypothetical protein RchiOBHm_Chr5g0064461 [Rosa chinensis]